MRLASIGLVVGALLASVGVQAWNLAEHGVQDKLLEAVLAVNRLTKMSNDIYDTADGATARLPVLRDNLYHSRDRIIKIRRSLDSMVGHDRVEAIRETIDRRIQKELDNIHAETHHEINSNWEDIKFSNNVNQRAWFVAYSTLSIAAIGLVIYACNLGRRIAAVCAPRKSEFAYL